MRTLVALACGLAGCWSWRTGGLAPEHMIANFHPNKVRIARITSEVVVLTGPRVQNGHIVGADAQTTAQRSVPLADIQRLEIWAPNGGETALLVGGILAGLGVIVFAVISSGLSGG